MIIKVKVRIEEYGSHADSISLCKYHFVWCRKYRHGMLELVRDELAELFEGIAERFGHEIVSVEVEIAPDHVQLFVEADSKWSPAEIAKQFTGYSGRTILKGHPEIKQRYFCGSGLWKDGYDVGTTGGVSEDVVRYIEEKEKETDH